MRRDFPEKDYATRDDNPVVSFHEIRAPEEVYLEPLDFPPGTARVVRSRDGQRTGGIQLPRSSRVKRAVARPRRASPRRKGEQ